VQVGNGNAMMVSAFTTTTNVIENMIVPTTVMKVMLLVLGLTKLSNSELVLEKNIVYLAILCTMLNWHVVIEIGAQCFTKETINSIFVVMDKPIMINMPLFTGNRDSVFAMTLNPQDHKTSPTNHRHHLKSAKRAHLL